MRRREFLGALVASSAGVSIGDGAAAGRARGRFRRRVRLTTSATSTVPEVAVDSGASLLDRNHDPLTDDAVAALWVEDTARNTDADGNGDAVIYPDDVSIPVVAVDWNVVGFGAMLVTDDRNWQYGNEEFVLNVWDDALGGAGTVLWDEGHGQYYTLSKFSEFAGYAEDDGYTVTATSSLTGDLGGADAAVVTSPGSAFSDAELRALGDFVANGGWLFLHDQSDYGNYDATAALDDVAAHLELSFRFNDDQVIDEVRNVNGNYQPVTTAFNTSFPYFEDRDGLGLDPSKTYTGTVTDVNDGDTVDVAFPDGTVESVRILGVDTPEKAANDRYERIQEWEGIESNTYLEGWADEATQFAKAELPVGTTVDVSFDPEEPARDVFGRVLGYVHYDADGDGSRDDFYNRRLVERGYARVYSSGLARHEEFWDAEAAAQANGRRVWTRSDPDDSTEIRNRDVDDLFLPWAGSVRTEAGAIADSRVPVYAEPTASQNLDGGVSYSRIPLAGVDEAGNVGLVGAPLVDEDYEKGEGYPVDTATFENFVFLTNLVDHLSDLDGGSVLIDGGHGQFNASYGLSCEDTAYYQRFLEGQDVAHEGVNELTGENLSRGRAIVVTAGPEPFTRSEVDALNAFRQDGGAVVLLGAGKLRTEARTHLNDLAAGLGTDLRLNEAQVLDESNNVDGDPEVPTTTVFDTSFPLFSAYTEDPAVVVETDAAANVGDTAATLQGALTDLGGAASAECYFEYREAGTSTWASTTARTLSATGAFSTDVTGLSAGTDHEYRAVADASDGDVAAGTTATFTTDSAGSAELAVRAIDREREWVDFENAGDVARELTGWAVEDEAGNRYEFPAGFELGAGETVRLHSGDGTDTSTDLYWGSDYVWNDGGDTCFLYDDAGSLVDRKSAPTGDLAVATVSHGDGSSLNDEHVVFENVGDGDLFLEGWAVADADGNRYGFPDGFALPAGDAVALHTGSGTDSSTDLYWGAGSYVWDAADTVSVYDDAGDLAVEASYDDAGDVAVAALNADEEWVDVTNDGASARELTGWAVEDEVGHRYEFPEGFELGAGETVRLHSGDGTDASTDLYWGNDYVWNDGGDTCYLYDGTGGPVDTYSY